MLLLLVLEAQVEQLPVGLGKHLVDFLHLAHLYLLAVGVAVVL
jgi:hypothetical protein